MKTYLPIAFIMVLIISACGPNRPTELTSEQLANERERVIQVIKDYNAAFEAEKYTEIIETISDDVVFFGSDSSEVIKSLPDFKTLVEEQWETFDIKYGEMYDMSIIMDNNATVASVIYGTPAEVTMNGKEIHYFFRIARTLKKVNNNWKIASGIVGITQQTPKPEDVEVDINMQ